MYAVVRHVEIKDAEAGDEYLHGQVVPTVRGLPGFVRAVWLTDPERKRGMGVLLFETEEHARAAVEAAPTLGEDAPVRFTRPPDVFVVAAEA